MKNSTEEADNYIMQAVNHIENAIEDRRKHVCLIFNFSKITRDYIVSALKKRYPKIETVAYINELKILL